MGRIILKENAGRIAVTKKGTKHRIIGETAEPLSGNPVVLVDSPYDENNEDYNRTYYGEGTWWMYPAEIIDIVTD